MTEVKFHLHVPDKAAYAGRLVRKAIAQGARVALVGEPELLDRLDARLWEEGGGTGFLAHARLPGAPAHVAQATSVLLCDAAGIAPHAEVLVNLGPSVPAGFERFERLIELVGAEEEELQAGRARWKHYRTRGYVLEQHVAAPPRAQA